MAPSRWAARASRSRPRLSTARYRARDSYRIRAFRIKAATRCDGLGPRLRRPIALSEAGRHWAESLSGTYLPTVGSPRRPSVAKSHDGSSTLQGNLGCRDRREEILNFQRDKAGPIVVPQSHHCGPEFPYSLQGWESGGD